jgi:hypothetical protein
MSDRAPPPNVTDAFELVPSNPFVQAPAAALPATDGEIWDAQWGHSADDRSSAENIRVAEGYAPIVEALGLNPSQNPILFSDTGMSGYFREPILRRSDLARDRGVGSRMVFRTDQEVLIGLEIRKRRQQDPNFLPGVPDTMSGIRQMFRDKAKANRAVNAEVLSRTDGSWRQWGVGFAAGSASLMLDPINIATMPLGGPGKTVATTFAREALVGGVVTGLSQPFVAERRAELGETLTLEEAATNTLMGAAGSAVLGTGLHVGGKGLGRGYDASVAQVFNLMPESVQRKWADRMKVATPDGGNMPFNEWAATLSSRDLAILARETIAPDRLTPHEQSALHVLDDVADLEESSPFTASPAGDAAHAENLAGALDAILAGRAAPEPSEGPVVRAATETDGGEAVASLSLPPVGRAADSTSSAARTPSSSAAPVSSAAAFDQVKRKIHRAETSATDDFNEASGALGPYQFLKSTWLSYYKRRFGSQGLSDAQIAGKRRDPQLNDVLVNDLLEDNARTLRSIGAGVNPGNLYLAHFAGPAMAKALLRAAPGESAEAIWRRVDPRNAAAAIANNGNVIKGKTASQVIQWAHGRMGGEVSAVPLAPGLSIGGAVQDAATLSAQLNGEAAALRSQADALRALASPTGAPPMHSGSFRPSSLLVDADTFQFKGGGDAYGVTERLAGVTEWNPMLSGSLVVWERADGSRFVADGHQRSGLARRIEDQTGAEIWLDATVLREADGVSAQDARLWAAIKNIAEGTGATVDGAKVVRDGGIERVLSHLPPKSPLVRDGAALARLSDDAFGAVYNGHLSADQAAVIGHMLPDQPDAHAGMVQLLIRLDPPNRGQAESIVRQAIAAGFHKSEQTDLFGTFDSTTSLFMERAKVLERGLARLKKLKLVYGTAAKEADTLERAGSKIARGRTEREAKQNADAIEIVSRLAFSAGPISDALNDAAGRLAGGEPLAGVVDGFVRSVRGIDLNAAAKDTPRARGDSLVPDGAGRGGDAGEEGPGSSAQSGGEGDLQPGVSAAELEEAGQLTAFDLDAAARFDDPAGDGARAQVESLEHDLKMDIEAGKPPAADRAMDPDTILSGQAGATLDDLIGRAAANQAELAAVARELEASIGAPFKDPGAKSKERVLEKVANEGYSDPGQIKDLAGGAFTVSAAADADKIVAELGRRYPVFDKGWKQLASGYVDRKVVIRFPNGGVAEVQIVPAAIAEYKFGDGHALYKKARDPSLPIADFERVVAQMRDDYSVLLEGSEFAALGKAAAKSAADSSVPSTSALRASAGDAAAQAVPLKTTAVSPSTETGLSSSSNNLMGSTSAAALDMGARPDPGKAARDAQLGALGAAAPMRGAADQDGTMGLGLFDAADQPTFRLDLDGEERTAGHILAELEEDAATIDALKLCALPGKAA